MRLFGGAPGVFVTGTDTGVGKTVLTAAICCASGAVPMKPAQTGVDDDVAFVIAATGRNVPRETAVPYRFSEPLAPAVAARRAGIRIDPDHIVSCFKELSRLGPVAVEGAGGLLVELAEGFTMADLAVTLGLPVVIACRPGLGTLNHCALTVEAARTRGLDVLGLAIVGRPSEPGLAERTNLEELPRIAPLAGVIPHIDGLDTGRGSPRELAGLARGALSPALGGAYPG